MCADKSVTPQIYENKKVCTADLSVRRLSLICADCRMPSSHSQLKQITADAPASATGVT